MDEEIEVEQQTSITSTQSTFQKNFCTVTPFSKYLALALFILLPVGGFWLGMQYGATSSEQFERVGYYTFGQQCTLDTECTCEGIPGETDTCGKPGQFPGCIENNCGWKYDDFKAQNDLADESLLEIDTPVSRGAPQEVHEIEIVTMLVEKGAEWYLNADDISDLPDYLVELQDAVDAFDYYVDFIFFEPDTTNEDFNARKSERRICVGAFKAPNEQPIVKAGNACNEKERVLSAEEQRLADNLRMDARIKSTLHSMRVVAELYYDDNLALNLGYGPETNSCTEGLFDSSKGEPLISEVVEEIGTDVQCRATKDSYAIAAELKTETKGYLCVDSTGLTVEIPAPGLTVGDTSCK